MTSSNVNLPRKWEKQAVQIHENARKNALLQLRGEAALDSIANNAAPSPDFRQQIEKKGKYLRERYIQRMWLRRALKGTRIARCGRQIENGKGINLYWSPEHGARYAGLQSCGSVWCCPVCNAKIQAQRLVEMKQALTWARENNLTVVFATHTVRHNKRQSLEHVRDMAQTVWRKCRSHAAVKKLFKRYGSKGYVRAQEVTWSNANGWHVHYHAYYFLRSGMTQKEVDAFGAAYSANWIKTAKDNRYAAPLEENQRFELLNLNNTADLEKAAKYVTQSKTSNLKSAANELTSTQTKLGKVKFHTDGSRVLHMSYWDMLRAYTDLSFQRQKASKIRPNSVKRDCDESYIIGYQEIREFGLTFERLQRLIKIYYLGMKFARALVWSRGLRARIGLDDERTDQELAQETFKDDKGLVLVLTIWNWRQRLTRPESEHLAADLLVRCEETKGDIRSCIDFCICHGIDTCKPSDHRYWRC